MGSWPEESGRPAEPLARQLEERLAEQVAEGPLARHFASVVGPQVAESA